MTRKVVEMLAGGDKARLGDEKSIPQGCRAEQENEARIASLMRRQLDLGYARTDHLFGILMIVQWLAAIAAALWLSPRAWAGTTSSSPHLHVWLAILAGGAITSFPVILTFARPARPYTRFSVAIGQMLMSSLLIHLSGGRMETHFHIFVSLAFLAFYRDWRVLVPATLVIMADHVFRGLFFPQSIFGVLAASPWRLAEHAAWLLFEDIILVTACLRSVAEMREIMIRKAAIETLRSNFEHKYWARTAELKSANLELEDEARVRRQILQAQKLESIGQLAAGIAHEVNTPIQYIGDNCLFLKTSFAELHEILRQHLELLAFVKATQPGAELVTRLEGRLAEIDAAFLLEEIPKAIDQSIEGVGRVSQIVTAMKEFSHPGSGEKSPVDLNHAILNTLTVCRNEIKYAANVVTELDPSLPKVHCLTGQINQVILNLVVNAAQAMETTRPKGELGTIRITTSSDGTFVEMRVADNGSGIPEAIRNRIFDPFFTTKEVGKGSGQGLAIARNAIVNQHGGSLEFETEENVGTTFIVRIPIQPAAEPPVEKAAGYGKVTEELLNSR